MTQKIRRKFIEGSTLPELEKNLNDFTDSFNPADVLDVLFFALQAKYTIIADKKKKSKEQEITNEVQTPTDRFVCLVTYVNQSTEVNLHG